MNAETENEESGAKSETEMMVKVDCLDKEGISPLTTAGPEDVPAENIPPHQDEDSTVLVKGNEEDMGVNQDDPVEEKVPCEPESSGSELSTGDIATTATEDGEKINEVVDPPAIQEEREVFETDVNNDVEEPRLHLETREGENRRDVQEQGSEEEEATAVPADKVDSSYEELMQLLQELNEERDRATQRSLQLQVELAQYFSRRSRDDTQQERELQESEQLQEYEKHMNILTELKQRLISESETARRQEEELSRQKEEKLEMVEEEWRALAALKKNVAVTVIRQHLGKKAAEAKVDSILAAEQLRQDQLIRARLKNIKLNFRIQRLEAELRDGEENAKDPLQIQFEKLQAERLELKKRAEKQNEESMKMQRKISSRLELLSNIKEKLFWSQTEVQAKHEQLAELEAMVASKRDLLTRTKQACSNLQRDNLRLKEQRGLLGNRALLWDFDNTVDTSNQLEEQLESLKDQQAEIMLRCGRLKKRNRHNTMN